MGRRRIVILPAAIGTVPRCRYLDRFLASPAAPGSAIAFVFDGGLRRAFLPVLRKFFAIGISPTLPSVPVAISCRYSLLLQQACPPDL